MKEKTTDKLRAAFEEWALDYGFDIERGQGLSTSYVDRDTRYAWVGYQAAPSSPPSPLEAAALKALEALGEVIPPHLRTNRHGENFMGQRYEIIRSAITELQQCLKKESASPLPVGNEEGDAGGVRVDAALEEEAKQHYRDLAGPLRPDWQDLSDKTRAMWIEHAQAKRRTSGVPGTGGDHA